MSTGNLGWVESWVRVRVFPAAHSSEWHTSFLFHMAVGYGLNTHRGFGGATEVWGGCITVTWPHTKLSSMADTAELKTWKMWLKSLNWSYCKDAFISATWLVIFSRFHFQFRTCYFSSVTALTTHVTVSKHHHPATISLLSEDDFAALSTELLSAGNMPRRSMQKPDKSRFSDAGAGSVPAQLTQTDSRHPFVIPFFLAMRQASEGADYIYVVNEFPNPVSNFTCMLNF